jgi:DNA-directed RNA polymerase subunit RPC12/RpoP
MVESPASLFPFACFACRRSFKRQAADRDEAVCPACGSAAIKLSRKFKPPARADTEQWDKVETLVSLGFRFETIYDGEGRLLRYPATKRGIHAFVEKVSKLRAQLAPHAAESKSSRGRAQPKGRLRKTLHRRTQ